MNEIIKILTEAENLEDLNLGVQLVNEIKDDLNDEEVEKIIEKIETNIMNSEKAQIFLKENKESFEKWIILYNYFYQKRKNKKAKKI